MVTQNNSRGGDRTVHGLSGLSASPVIVDWPQEQFDDSSPVDDSAAVDSLPAPVLPSIDSEPPQNPVGEASAVCLPQSPDEPEVTLCDRCGCSRMKDIPIHGGRSIRRDCARCGRFKNFSVWYGEQKA